MVELTICVLGESLFLDVLTDMVSSPAVKHASAMVAVELD
jgi:hypothetical protein